jgi:hypothetical protein
MSSRLILGVLLAIAALFLVACKVEEEGEEPDASALPQTTAEATVGVAATQATRAATTTQVTQGVLGCPDCVKAGDQLEVTTADIQLGEDGKYYIADRGDGCAYRETARTPARVIGALQLPEMAMLWADDCEVGYSYEPTTGRLNAVVP